MATKFKVKVGTHVDVDRKYIAGETLISDQSLDTMFPGKFENLGVVALRNPLMSSPPTVPIPPTVPAPVSRPKQEDPEEEDDDKIQPIKKKEPKAVVREEPPVEARTGRRSPA